MPPEDAARQTADADDAAKARAAAMVGKVISDRYRIEAVLAMGGMAAVYRANHLTLKKRVAIKILHPETEGFPELVARFEREAVAGAHVQHPNVAVATDFGNLPDGSYYLTLEYARGTTLHEIMKEGRVPVARAARIVRQLAAALAAIHDRGIVHRDVKPRNIMVDTANRDFVKLIDFGLAKMHMSRFSTFEEDEEARPSERLTVGDVIFGTIAYLAPEAIIGMHVLDTRADLYAVGVVFYEMLAGRHLFDVVEPAELFRAHREDPPQPLAERSPGLEVPAALEALIMRLLAKDPDARFQSAADLATALEAAVPGIDVPSESARPPPKAGGSVSPPSGAPTKTAPGRDDSEPSVTIRESTIDATTAAEAERSANVTPPKDTAAEPGVAEAEAAVPSKRPRARPPPVPSAAARAARQKKQAAAAPAGRRRPREVVREIDRKARAAAAAARARAASVPRGAWGIVIAGLLALSIIVWRMSESEIPSAPGAAAESAAPGAATSPTTAAPPPAPTTEPTAAPAGSAVRLPTDPTRAKALRAQLLASVKSASWGEATDALLALADVDRGALQDAAVRDTARRVAMALELKGNQRAIPVFDALADDFAPEGLDVLYGFVETGGKSRSAKRAGDLLAKPEVLARGTPAMRIAFELRQAPCNEKLALIDRAERDGDVRTLVTLETTVRRCFDRAPSVDRAMATLRKRLRK